MRLAFLSEIPDGATVGRDVLGGPDRAPLLRAGVILTPEYRIGLLRAGVHAIYIEDECSQGIVPPQPLLSEATQEVAGRAVAQIYAEAQVALAAGCPLDPDRAEVLTPALELMLGEVRACRQAAVALHDLAAADAYTFQHSIDVTALGMLLGARLFEAQGWSPHAGAGGRSDVDERLLVLGMGLLLHDIGKLTIPAAILHKPRPLTRAERELVENHPQSGFELLASGAWSPLVKAVVLRHHERWNGSGYPDGLAGNEIHPMARIAAVADVYDALTSERPYAPARPAHEALDIITRAMGTLFEPTVAALLRRVVLPFPPGVEVRLNNGRRALVVAVDEQAIDRPAVRLIDGPGAPREIALIEHPALAIAG